MIVSKIQGGLANQIFQWAYGYCLSKKYNQKYYLDVSFFLGGCKGCTPRTFDLPYFKNIDINLFDGQVIKDFFSEKVFQITDPNRYEPSLPVDPVNFNILLDGFWQSELYFIDYRDDILNLLEFEDNPKFKSFDFTNSCSLHIRRTDYLNAPKFHTNLDLSYYDKCLEDLNHNGPIYVFSDDINWCRNTLKYPHIHFVEGNSNTEDLKLMSLCEHNIIANSSFSWWAAWLNKNPEKKVFAPYHWFGPEGPGYGDIVPNSWIKIL